MSPPLIGTPSPASPPGVAIRWIPSADRATARRIWQELETRVDAGVADSWSWTETWLEIYGDVVLHRFAIGESDGVPCGIALVTRGVGRKVGPLPLRTVHLGTAGEPPGESVYVQYNRVLVEREHRGAFAAALMGELRDEPDWQELRLEGFSPEDVAPFLAAEPRLVARRELCPVTELRDADDTDGDVIATLQAKTRKKFRRSLRGLGELHTEWAETTDHGLEILHELIALHQARWARAGQPGAFSSRRFTAFHRALVTRLAPTGRILLFRVGAASGTVGCVYGFVERGRVNSYQTGLAAYADPQIRPGFVTLALCMQACYERGLREYNLLSGDVVYKRELSTGERELVWATWRRPALRWSVAEELAGLRRRGRALARLTGRG